MKWLSVDPCEYLYPDITDYVSGTQEVSVLTARNSYACVQLLFTGVTGNTLTVSCEGWNPEIYEMAAVHVERNQGMTADNAAPHQPERTAPYDVYDCLKPARDGIVAVKDGVCAVYLSEYLPADSAVGVRSVTVQAGDTVIPVTLEVSRAVVPGESLTMIVGYNQGNVCTYHHVERNSPAFAELNRKYLTMLRRMHQNMLYCPKPKATKVGENLYTFDFSEMEHFISEAVSLGYTKFNFGVGFRQSWSASTILVDGLPSMSFECYCYLAQMLPALVSFLREHGWEDKLILGIADEPNNYNATEYRALCGLVRKLAPSLKLLDAMSFGPVHGAIDIWIPLNAEYDRHRKEIETFRTYGDDIWYYDCCGPRGEGYINRFIDYPLLATRYHFWGSYCYNLTGYLHWAANFYMPGQDPFTQSCPEHHNADSVCYLPAGDTHIMYPGDGEPWMSVRLENQRASAEEYELLKALAKTDKPAADGICSSVFGSFRDVDYSAAHFRAARNRLIRACESL